LEVRRSRRIQIRNSLTPVKQEKMEKSPGQADLRVRLNRKKIE
jgi:hypothetical protein